MKKIVRALVPVLLSLLAVAVLPQCLHIESLHVMGSMLHQSMGSMLHQSRAVDIQSFKEVMLEIDIAEPPYQKQTKHTTQ